VPATGNIVLAADKLLIIAENTVAHAQGNNPGGSGMPCRPSTAAYLSRYKRFEQRGYTPSDQR